DGDLARLTGRAGPRGELIDGLADYGGHLVLYGALGVILSHQIGGWGWVLAVAAAASRIVQAIHYETQRRQYRFMVYGTPWLGSASEGRNAIADMYRTLGHLLVPRSRDASTWFAAIAHTPCRPLAADRVFAAYRPLLRSSALLGANMRTLALGASMIAGSPLYYVVYEMLLLNAVLVRSILHCRQVHVAMLDTLPRLATA
ncbi:MAG: CDP-alcohol phosphatidyltransferase, partial [Pontixanthobacter sp.]